MTTETPKGYPLMTIQLTIDLSDLLRVINTKPALRFPAASTLTYALHNRQDLVITADAGDPRVAAFLKGLYAEFWNQLDDDDDEDSILFEVMVDGVIVKDFGTFFQSL